jgi:hypothetical protein
MFLNFEWPATAHLFLVFLVPHAVCTGSAENLYNSGPLPFHPAANAIGRSSHVENGRVRDATTDLVTPEAIRSIASRKRSG